MVLRNSSLVVTLPAVDLDRAKSFYQDKLECRLLDADDHGARLECGKGSDVYLYKRAPTTADHTVFGFIVPDVEREMVELRRKGIVFEEYEMPEMGLKTVNGIAEYNGEKAAWFKDSEGNILSIFEVLD